jgi:hypothetical protein
MVMVQKVLFAWESSVLKIWLINQASCPKKRGGSSPPKLLGSVRNPTFMMIKEVVQLDLLP